MCCIFIANDNWATLRFVATAKFKRIAEYETEFGVTIHRTHNVTDRADAGEIMLNAKQ